MRSLDTNILARYVMVDDDPDQTAIATRLLSEPCFVPTTVLLELGWLLRSRYGLDRRTLADTLDDLLRLPALVVDDRDAIRWAVERFEAGADLADMLHLVTSTPATRFATFDRKLARGAGAVPPVPVETLGA